MAEALRDTDSPIGRDILHGNSLVEHVSNTHSHLFDATYGSAATKQNYKPDPPSNVFFMFHYRSLLPLSRIEADYRIAGCCMLPQIVVASQMVALCRNPS